MGRRTRARGGRRRTGVRGDAVHRGAAWLRGQARAGRLAVLKTRVARRDRRHRIAVGPGGARGGDRQRRLGDRERALRGVGVVRGVADAVGLDRAGARPQQRDGRHGDAADRRRQRRVGRRQPRVGGRIEDERRLAVGAVGDRRERDGLDRARRADRHVALPSVDRAGVVAGREVRGARDAGCRVGAATAATRVVPAIAITAATTTGVAATATARPLSRGATAAEAAVAVVAVARVAEAAAAAADEGRARIVDGAAGEQAAATTTAHCTIVASRTTVAAGATSAGVVAFARRARRRPHARRTHRSRVVAGVVAVAAATARNHERSIRRRRHERAATTTARRCHAGVRRPHLPRQDLEDLPGREVDATLQHHAATTEHGLPRPPLHASGTRRAGGGDLVGAGDGHLPVLDTAGDGEERGVVVPGRRVVGLAGALRRAARTGLPARRERVAGEVVELAHGGRRRCRACGARSRVAGSVDRAVGGEARGEAAVVAGHINRARGAGICARREDAPGGVTGVGEVRGSNAVHGLGERRHVGRRRAGDERVRQRGPRDVRHDGVDRDRECR